MPSSQLEVYPQLLLACLAALTTTSVHVFSLLLKLLCEVRFSPRKASSSSALIGYLRTGCKEVSL